MTPDPLVALLDVERANFLAQVARVPETYHATRPAPDRWSLAEIVEHAARAALKKAYATADATVLDGATYPHPLIGPLTVRAWLELTAHHDARHAQQVAELAG